MLVGTSNLTPFVLHVDEKGSWLVAHVMDGPDAGAKLVVPLSGAMLIIDKKKVTDG